jgi:dUTP pyrophosphatase
MKIKFQKLHPDAATPSYAKPGDAGLDLTAVGFQVTPSYISYKTGLAFEIPEGYVGLLFPRSSNSKKQLLLTNSVGVIDSGYRGEIEFRFKLVGNGVIPEGDLDIYQVGDKVGQILILPYPQIELQEENNLSDSERGTDGFGSTGN